MGTVTMTKSGTAFLALLLATSLTALAGTAKAAEPFMHTGGRTTQPVGHYELCRHAPEECREMTPRQAPVTLTRKLWSAMVEVNNVVNTTVTPRTDMDIWGKEEVWSYPDRVGDCEDYVLEKRRELMQRGVPAGNLLITVVKQPNGDGHAVLTVHTSNGDYVLDNLEPRILAWQDTEYTFLKRQSVRNSGAWVAIDDDRNVAVGSVQ
jgi:predicted transglutaminase-like cysteine proteinase